MEHNDVFLLETIVELCDRITASIAKHGDDFDVFDADVDYQDFCAFRVIQIGEYANSLSETFTKKHNEIPWRNIVGLRNILVHDYGKVSNQKFWATLKKDIPSLREFCASQIKSL